jgi:hypothetical protein
LVSLATRVTLAAVLLGWLAGAGCSASPARRFSERAADLGMRAEIVHGGPFDHAVWRRAASLSRTLHVYLDGDGTPWASGHPAADPTPRDPLVLRLMAQDLAPSVYLGRPCYHGLAAPPCRPALWTSARYSEEVVASMAAALRRIATAGGFDRFVWLGYSGTLAVLLAPRFAETTDVATVAANLDVDAWADLHGYTRLAGSLNPLAAPPLPARITQRHFAGGRDRVVPRQMIRGPIDPAAVTVVGAFDHVCCWEAMWPKLLAEIDGPKR